MQKATETKKYLIVSIHDVTPAKAEACLHLIDQLRNLGVKKTSLLLVPNYHEQGRWPADAPLTKQLKQLETAGHEIVLHGYTHAGRRQPLTTPWRALVSRVYTRGQGEFYDLSAEAVAERLQGGLLVLKDLGFSPRGFVAPAWLYNDNFVAEAKKQGLSYYTDRFALHPLDGRPPVRAKAVVFSNSTWYRRLISVNYCKGLARLQQDQPLVRLALHPPDILHPSIWQTVKEILQHLLQDRTVTTYAEIVNAL